jgi:hypothetical protein
MQLAMLLLTFLQCITRILKVIVVPHIEVFIMSGDSKQPVALVSVNAFDSMRISVNLGTCKRQNHSLTANCYSSKHHHDQSAIRLSRIPAN